MSPIYEDEKLTREDLFELRKKHICSVCRGALDVFLDVDMGKAFLACQDWRRSQHEGIERLAHPAFEPNILTRREDMTQELGETKTRALEKYAGVVSLTKAQAMLILKTIWPEAPDVEVLKAAMTCAQYGLNPLNHHIFLIPFNKGESDETWAIVMGIKAKRLLASRRGPFSYVDNTPRKMTDQEQQDTFGTTDSDRIWVMTKLRDPATGAESVGYGFWLNKDKPKGENKGNTRFNMAAIRSESQALDRLRPGEMPQGIEAVEESTIESEFSVVDESHSSKPGVAEKTVPTGGGDKKGAGISATKGKAQNSAVAPPPAEDKVVGEGFTIDLTWLKEALQTLKWSEDTCKTFLISHYKVSPQGSLEDTLKRLTREQAEEFVKEIQSRWEKQASLF